ncbi:IclR family transcriptional regulator [Frankia sp. CiP3]|uniref:IclR family transcriptional regulator n=1 Tax=Frankia sp. CiP3 TaxID=2880971 RepID=UPI001EF4EA68|nr:IclR family transcriptional regulator [Frankia sp. CiP3]
MTVTAPTRLSDRLIGIVESFLAAPSQSLSEVAAACGLEPSTTTRYLRQLVDHGWLERDEVSRCYSLGVRMITIGHAARRARPLRGRVLPYMRELLARFDETINLAVNQTGEVVIIEALEGRRSIRRGATVGDRDDWFVSSLGKSILAHLPDDEVRELLRTRPPERHTALTRTDPADVLADLADIRRRGYALDNEEAEIGMKCVGVPIRDDRGRYRFALSVSGPTARMNDRLDDIVDALKAVARNVSAEGEAS